MRRWRAWISRVGGLFGKERRERELSAELRSHLELHVEDNLRVGMTPEEARRHAVLKLGGVEQTKERFREQRGLPFLDVFFQDLRFAARMFLKNPGLTAVAVLTIALGIGANSTIFSFVSGVLLRTPPLPDAGRAMVISSINPKSVWGADRYPVSALDFLDWRAQSSSFSSMAAASFDDVTLAGGNAPERLSAARVSADYFRVMGVAPVLGRAFVPDDFGGGLDKVAVLSAGIFKERFGGDAQILRQTVKVNGNPCTIVGIMPARFDLVDFPAQIWLPLTFRADELNPAARSDRRLRVFARLKPSVAAGRANSDMQTIAQRLAQTYPDTSKGWGASVMSLQEYTVADANITTAVVFLMGAVGFVLLIACANIANLLLAHNSARRREFTVRAAMGASPSRLMRQLLTECLLLSLAGGGLGVLFAWGGLQIVRVQINWNSFAVSLAQQLSVDRAVLLFSLGVSVLAAVVFGLAPALQISRTDPRAGLQDGSRGTTPGRSRHRLQQGLVVLELALSCILLVGAGLFMKNFLDELRVKPGFNTQNVLTATVPLSGLEFLDPGHQRDFFVRASRQLENSPEVKSVAITSDLPFTFPGGVRFALETKRALKPNERPTAGYYAVSPGYFAALQIPLLQGREFAASDTADAPPVAIVDDAFVRHYLEGASPIGTRILVQHNGAQEQWSEIVGVVQSISEYSGQRKERPHIFECFLARPSPAMTVAVRTAVPSPGFSDSLRRAIAAVDPAQAVTDLRTMDKVIADSEQGDNVMAEWMTTFALLALLMAAVGVYGVLSHSVGQRTHEIAVRLALGARPEKVLGLVLRQAASLAALGVGIGFLVSLGLPKLFAASFTDFHVASVGIVVGTPLLVSAAALLSCYVPAVRAARIEPMAALRQD